MLMVNWNHVNVDLSTRKKPPAQPQWARRMRLREADCSAAAARASPPECRTDGNGMYDQRIRRGSNYARARPPTPQPQPSLAVRRKLLEAKRRLQLKIQLGAGDSGRASVYVQCEPQGPAEPRTRTQAMQCQISPRYVPQDIGIEVVKTSTGVDASTQVCDADLTDFKREWYAPAKNLVSAVLNQATVCVVYEDDAVWFRREQDVYRRRRLAELVELDRLDCIEAARLSRAQKELETVERAAPGPSYRAMYARALAEHTVAGVADRAMRQLEMADYTQTDRQMIDWLSARVYDHCKHRAKREAHLDDLIRDAIVNRRQVYKRLQREIAEKRRHDAGRPETRQSSHGTLPPRL
ncbi:Radial spoke 3 [Cinara cedri]|uniref:Radial spoke 3 n=1 Tax=Cinara cedri TaxID=506608 RepID=A0A5E4NL50_9HEMI|nr:Radial spoke 3 [Cinara cedri]